jgi:hypothetical protein
MNTGKVKGNGGGDVIKRGSKKKKNGNGNLNYRYANGDKLKGKNHKRANICICLTRKKIFIIEKCYRYQTTTALQKMLWISDRRFCHRAEVNRRNLEIKFNYTVPIVP